MSNFQPDDGAIDRYVADLMARLAPAIQRVLDPIQKARLGRPVEEVQSALMRARWPEGFDRSNLSGWAATIAGGQPIRVVAR